MTVPQASIRPVILGGDIGAYATARAFHEAFGVRSVVVAGISTGAVARSRIVDHRIVGDLDSAATLVAALRAIAAEEPERTHIVLGSADWFVHTLSEHRAEILADRTNVVVPYVDTRTLDAVTDKAAFSRLCAELDIPHPRTRVVRVGAAEDVDGELTFPVVVKAASSTDFHAVEFVGKRKVDIVPDAASLRALLARMVQAGFAGEVVVQEFVGGGDEQMAAVNAFCGPDGGVEFLLFGQVLLEEHTPNGLGNSVAQITGGAHAHDEAVSHARRLLEHVGWSGFANLDMKRDPRDGTYRFLELNPRVGRSGYAVTAAGYNVGKMYARAYASPPDGPDGPDGLEALDAPGMPPGTGSGMGPMDGVVATNEHLFTVVPLALLKRYVSPPVWERIRSLRKRGAVTNPYLYAVERDPRRWAYIAVAMVNQFRKFAEHHRPSG